MVWTVWNTYFFVLFHDPWIWLRFCCMRALLDFDKRSFSATQPSRTEPTLAAHPEKGCSSNKGQDDSSDCVVFVVSLAIKWDWLLQPPATLLYSSPALQPLHGLTQAQAHFIPLRIVHLHPEWLGAALSSWAVLSCREIWGIFVSEGERVVLVDAYLWKGPVPGMHFAPFQSKSGLSVSCEDFCHSKCVSYTCPGGAASTSQALPPMQVFPLPAKAGTEEVCGLPLIWGWELLPLSPPLHSVCCLLPG